MDKPAAAAAGSKPRLFCVTRLAWGFFVLVNHKFHFKIPPLTDARARSEARLKLLSVILYFELGYQGWGEQALPFCHPWFARVCLV